MAKIIFTAVAASITGKLAGSVFQRSHGGAQLRTKVSPNNRRTSLQNPIRVSMHVVTAAWRSLSADDRATWYNGNTPASNAFQYFVKVNQQLFIAGLPMVSTFVQPKPLLALTQEALSTPDIPFSVAILVNVDSAPHGYTQVLRWSGWLPPGVRFASSIGLVLSNDNFSWDADASGYNFDPSAADYPPGSGWSMRVAYGAIENATGIISLSNYLEFVNP